MKTIFLKAGIFLFLLINARSSVFSQPRFVAFNVYQFSSISGRSRVVPKETVKNYPVCFTGIGIGDDIYMGADMSIIGGLIPFLAGNKATQEENTNGFRGYDGGFLTLYGGKQLVTEDNFTFGAGIDFDFRALTFEHLMVGDRVGIPQAAKVAIGPQICAQYRPNKILTFVSVLGTGIGNVFEIQWRNSISVGIGKLGFNFQPDFNRYIISDFSKEEEKKWKISSRFLRFGISFRMD